MNVWTTGPHPYKMILFLQAGADRRGESWRLQSENTRRRRRRGGEGGEGGNWAHPWKRSVSFDFDIVKPKFDQIAVNADSDDVEKNKNGRNFHTHWVVLPQIPTLSFPFHPPTPSTTITKVYFLSKSSYRKSNLCVLVGTTTSLWNDIFDSYWQGCSALLRWQILIIRLSSFPPFLSQLLED